MNNQDLIGRKINLNEIGIIKNYNPITNEFIVKTKTYEVYIDAFKIQAHLVEETEEEKKYCPIKGKLLSNETQIQDINKMFEIDLNTKIEQLAKELFVKNCLYYIDNALEAQASNAIRAAKAFYNQLNQN